MVTKQYKGTDQTATGTSRSSTKRLTKPPQEHGHEAVQREERHESIVRCLQQHDALAHASVAHCDGAVHEWHVPKGVRHTRTHIHTHARTRTQRSVRFDLFLGEKGNTSHASTPRGHGGVSRIAWQEGQRGCQPHSVAGMRGSPRQAWRHVHVREGEQQEVAWDARVHTDTSEDRRLDKPGRCGCTCTATNHSPINNRIKFI